MHAVKRQADVLLKPATQSNICRYVRGLSSTSNGSTPKSKLQGRLPAAYYRGGTSRAIMFRREDLPTETAQWPRIFLGCIGSPDPYGRQLDGMGGGISSLSKVCVVGPSNESNADVDYTFFAIGVKDSDVDLSSNCGNMSAAVGPFAIESGMLSPATATKKDSKSTVRIFNTNTKKVIHAEFETDGGEANVYGDFAIDGVAGTTSAIALRFIDPAGSRTGRFLPTGNLADTIDSISVTCIDAGNPCCFVPASALGVEGTITPQQIDDHPTLKTRIESIRRQAGVLMALAKSEQECPGSVPKIAIVSKPSQTSSHKGDVVVRAMSVGQPHKAVPVTVALALATAANKRGTVVSDCVSKEMSARSEIVVEHASGTLTVGAKFDSDGKLAHATVLRTARRLMEGTVFWKT